MKFLKGSLNKTKPHYFMIWVSIEAIKRKLKFKLGTQK